MKTKGKSKVVKNKTTVLVDKALDKIKIEFLSGTDRELIASHIILTA